MALIRRGRKLYEIVIEELKVLIASEGLQPGDKLPTERELVEILNVSRTPLREALMVLQTEGYLEILQGKGIFLKDATPDGPIDMNDADGQKMWDYLQEARTVLECALSHLAAQRATEADVKRMEEAVARLEDPQNLNDLVIRVRADYDFHYNVAKAAGNPVLSELLQQTDEKLYSGRSATLSFPKGREKASKAHRRILEAIRQRNPEEAYREMEKHIKEVAHAQKQMLALKKREASEE